MPGLKGPALLGFIAQQKGADLRIRSFKDAAQFVYDSTPEWQTAKVQKSFDAVFRRRQPTSTHVLRRVVDLDPSVESVGPFDEDRLWEFLNDPPDADWKYVQEISFLDTRVIDDLAHRDPFFYYGESKVQKPDTARVREVASLNRFDSLSYLILLNGAARHRRWVQLTRLSGALGCSVAHRLASVLPLSVCGVDFVEHALTPDRHDMGWAPLALVCPPSRLDIESRLARHGELIDEAISRGRLNLSTRNQALTLLSVADDYPLDAGGYDQVLNAVKGRLSPKRSRVVHQHIERALRELDSVPPDFDYSARSYASITFVFGNTNSPRDPTRRHRGPSHPRPDRGKSVQPAHRHQHTRSVTPVSANAGAPVNRTPR